MAGRVDSMAGLTGRVIEFLEEEVGEGGVVDMKGMAVSMEIGLRRVYDVVNVLVGIGAVTKELHPLEEKHVMRWIGLSTLSNLHEVDDCGSLTALQSVARAVWTRLQGLGDGETMDPQAFGQSLYLSMAAAEAPSSASSASVNEKSVRRRVYDVVNVLIGAGLATRLSSPRNHVMLATHAN